MFKKNKAGFTLIELLVVIAIIGLLSSLATAALSSARKKSKIAKALHDTDQLSKAIEMMGNDTGVWPGHEEIGKASTTGGVLFCGDNAICDSTASSSAGIVANDTTYENWGGPYMKKAEVDAWGNEYFFSTAYPVNIDNEPCNGGAGCSPAAVVGSNGPDGVRDDPNGEDDIIRIMAK
jgi:general secretion pathway protein G